VATECAEQKGLHIQEDHFLPEILDPVTLEPMGYGKEGELCFTTLTKEGMPLIRYRTRDLCTITDAPCKCGRTGARMGKIKGRTDDMLIVRGVNVFPSQIESVLLSVKGASPHYQIVVDRINMQDRLTVRVEMLPAMFGDTTQSIEDVRGRIEKELADVLGLGAVVKMVEPDSIARSEGKAKRVTDNRVL
jgi:phenylacetate-CoA ligase